MTQPTIKDIAKNLNISASTVSRALNNHPDISPNTKDLVKKMAKELNYFPNTIAQSLKNRSSKTIGVIVPEIRHAFFASAISGIEKIAYDSGYTIMVCQSNESYDREVTNTFALEAQRVAGLIVSISQNTKNSDHFKAVQSRGVPLVFFDRVCEDVEASKVIIDDIESAYKAVTHLINKGYKKIAHITGTADLKIAFDRLEGYKNALADNNIELDESLIVFNGFHEENGYQSISKLVDSGVIPDAVFAVNDPVAIGVFKRVKEYGMKIPDDIALVGFSNNPITSLIEPSLTTVDQPSFEMGKKATELLLDEINNKNSVVHKSEILKTTLIIRNSS